MKYVVWALILFGMYSGYQFLPLATTKGSVEHAVQGALGDIKDGLSDEALRNRIVRRAKTVSLEIDPSSISIERERQGGQRIFRIDLELPIAIDYLGQERLFQQVAHFEEAVQIDEAAEARRMAQQKRFDDRVQRINAANDKVLDAKADCERATGGKCVVTGNGGGRMAPTDVDIIKNY